MSKAAEKLSAKEIAIEWDSNARLVRKFFRSDASGVDSVGQGNRYAFTPAEVKRLAKKFAAWVVTEKETTTPDAE